MARHELTDTSDQDAQLSVAESILQSLLLSDYKLELNAQARMLSLLNTHAPHPCPAAVHQERVEYPSHSSLVSYYAPHEVLLASLTSLSSTDCHKRLQEAQKSGSRALKQELKPVHRALSGIRAKLDKLYPPLKISPIREVGYVLTSSHNKEL